MGTAGGVYALRAERSRREEESRGHTLPLLPAPSRRRAELDAYEKADPALYEALRINIRYTVTDVTRRHASWKDPLDTVTLAPNGYPTYRLQCDLSKNQERDRLIRLIYAEEVEPRAARAKAEGWPDWEWFFSAFRIGPGVGAAGQRPR